MEKEETIQAKRKVAFYTLGCKVNQYETNAMIQQFQEHGYELVEFEEKADIYIINTCTVTNMSDKKSREMLRRAKKQNPVSTLVAVGCYAQVGKEKLEQIPEIDLILGTNEKNNIVAYVEKYRKEKKREEVVTDVMQMREFQDFGTITYTDKNRAAIKVQDGCDRFCSYCIIPYARGRVRSRKIESVVKEAEEVSKKGVKEIVITGIHIASYGKDLPENISLIHLLEALNAVPTIQRIRLGSLEPKLMTKEFIERLVKLEKICDHFHLSLQSGCNATLARMNRRYTTEEFYEVVTMLRQAYPNVSLTTDIIVGFPGETEEEFEETYQFLQKVQFYKMHVFKYSPRSGTKAAQMKEQIDGNKKEIRSNRLLELSDKNQQEQNKKEFGKVVEVLWEEYKDGYYIGHTTNYEEVKINTQEQLENTITKVTITGTNGLTLLGE